MKVLYDNQIFATQKFGGISRYFVELIENIQCLGVKYKLPFTLSDNIYLKDILALPGFRGKKRIYRIVDKLLSNVCLLGKYDLFHPTYYDPYFLRRVKSPFVLTVHDLIHEKFEEFSHDITLINKKKLIGKAERIIAISEHTKQDIVEVYGIDPLKIDVVYHGVTIVEPKRMEKLPLRYILFTGQRNGYKNFRNLCVAFAKLLREDRTLSLVCTGNAFSPDEISFFRLLNISNNIFHVFADEYQLAYLYKNALCFVYPSLYEGFGIPILEAFGYNCPICLSNASCFPEIAGNGGVYFDPNDPNDIVAAIKSIIEDATLRLNILNNGAAILRNYSWEKMAQETYSVYKKIVG